MGRKFKVYMDSGANIHSKYEQVVDLEDIGMDSEDWDQLEQEEKDSVMQEIAWERMEWGYEEIE